MAYILFFSQILVMVFLTLNRATFGSDDKFNTYTEFLNVISSPNKLSEKWKDEGNDISFLCASSKQSKRKAVTDSMH